MMRGLVPPLCKTCGAPIDLAPDGDPRFKESATIIGGLTRELAVCRKELSLTIDERNQFRLAAIELKKILAHLSRVHGPCLQRDSETHFDGCLWCKVKEVLELTSFVMPFGETGRQ